MTECGMAKEGYSRYKRDSALFSFLFAELLDSVIGPRITENVGSGDSQFRVSLDETSEEAVESRVEYRESSERTGEEDEDPNGFICAARDIGGL